MRICLLLFVVMLLHGCSDIKTIDWEFGNFDKIKSAEHKLYTDRGVSVDTLCVDGFNWGMTKDEVLESVLDNGFSKGIFPNRPTYSNIILFGRKHEVEIEYGFDKDGFLRSIIIYFIKDRTDNILNECLKNLGDKCINVKINREEGYYLWYYGNQEVKYSYGGLWGNANLMLSDASYLESLFEFDAPIVYVLDKVYAKLMNKDNAYLNRFNQSVSADEKEWLLKYVEEYGNLYIKYSYVEGGDEPGYIWFDGKRYIEVVTDYRHTNIFSRKDFVAENATYIINQKGKIYVKDTINGNNIINEKATSYFGEPYYYCVTNLDKLSVIDTLKGWVKIRHKDFSQNCGWVLADYVDLEENSLKEVAQNRVRFSNKKRSNQSFDYYCSDYDEGEYQKSLIRGKMLKDAGFEREADLEKRDRINKMKGVSSGYSTDSNYTPTISEEGKYHTIDGRKKQIQYQGSSEQKRDLDIIDEYMRTHPDF